MVKNNLRYRPRRQRDYTIYVERRSVLAAVRFAVEVH